GRAELALVGVEVAARHRELASSARDGASGGRAIAPEDLGREIAGDIAGEGVREGGHLDGATGNAFGGVERARRDSEDVALGDGDGADRRGGGGGLATAVVVEVRQNDGGREGAFVGVRVRAADAEGAAGASDGATGGRSVAPVDGGAKVR